MIGYIEGKLLKKEDDKILLLSNQIGYEILLPAIVMETLQTKKIGDDVALDVDATITINDTVLADLVLGELPTIAIGNIPAGDWAVATWNLDCLDDGGVTVVVEAQGTNTNIAQGCAAVAQIDPPVYVWANLSVEPTSGPVPLTINAVAVVTNFGDAIAPPCQAELKVDGVVVDTQTFIVDPKLEPVTVYFTYEFTEKGVYLVTIDELPPVEVIVGDPICQKGDMNFDGHCDFMDFVLFGEAYDSVEGDPNYNPCGDFNDDGVIDFTDFVDFGLVYETF